MICFFWMNIQEWITGSCVKWVVIIMLHIFKSGCTLLHSHLEMYQSPLSLYFAFMWFSEESNEIIASNFKLTFVSLILVIGITSVVFHISKL